MVMVEVVDDVIVTVDRVDVDETVVVDVPVDVDVTDVVVVVVVVTAGAMPIWTTGCSVKTKLRCRFADAKQPSKPLTEDEPPTRKKQEGPIDPSQSTTAPLRVRCIGN